MFSHRDLANLRVKPLRQPSEMSYEAVKPGSTLLAHPYQSSCEADRFSVHSYLSLHVRASRPRREPHLLWSGRSVATYRTATKCALIFGLKLEVVDVDCDEVLDLYRLLISVMKHRGTLHLVFDEGIEMHEHVVRAPLAAFFDQFPYGTGPDVFVCFFHLKVMRLGFCSPFNEASP